MKKYLCLLIVLMPILSFGDEIVTTKDGTKIRLKDDFTWEYVIEEQRTTNYKWITRITQDAISDVKTITFRLSAEGYLGDNILAPNLVLSKTGEQTDVFVKWKIFLGRAPAESVEVTYRIGREEPQTIAWKLVKDKHAIFRSLSVTLYPLPASRLIRFMARSNTKSFAVQALDSDENTKTLAFNTNGLKELILQYPELKEDWLFPADRE